MESPRTTAADGLLDRARFEAFYDRALPVVFGYVWRKSGRSHDIAMELTQDTFLGAVRALRSGVRIDEPLAWIMAMATSQEPPLLVPHQTRDRNTWSRTRMLASPHLFADSSAKARAASASSSSA